MKAIILRLLIISPLLFGNNLFGQNKQTYKVNGTTYVSGETYKTTGQSKVDRSSSAKNEFLKSKGYSKVPSGYQVDHKVPLSEGGADKPSNMQLISTEQHKIKTANERSSNTNPSDSTSSYSNSTYKSSNSYSTPSYSSGSSKTIYTGSKGGQYSINSNGNKSYVKRK